MRRDLLFEIAAPRVEARDPAGPDGPDGTAGTARTATASVAPAIRDAISDAFGAAPSDGTGWTIPIATAVAGSTLTADVEPTATGCRIHLSAHAPFALPFFSWAIGPLVAKELGRRLDHTRQRIEAALAGSPVPAGPRPVMLLPSVAFSPAQATMLATAAFVTSLATFGGALLGQNAGPIASSFGASDSRLGVVLALSRAGVLVGLVFSSLADRRGRRTLALWALVGIAVANGLACVAPTLWTFAATQVLTRGFVNAAAVIAAIAAIEEAPEGARAFSSTMVAVAGGMGFAVAVAAFPLTDLAPWAWRVGFGLSALTLLWLPRLARALPETSRYESLKAQSSLERGRLSDVIERRYRSRLLFAGLTAFLINMFNSPSAQFMNKYLQDDRGYSAAGISVFRAASGALPGLVGMVIAARLTESRGRKPVAIIGLFLGTLGQQLFFLTSGAPMWAAAMVSIVAIGCGSIAIGTLDAELFPTNVRGTSSAVLLLLGVSGSITGLLLAGFLSDQVGGLGRAVAWTGVGALVAALVFVPRLPESAARDLDDLSPPDRDARLADS